MDERRPSLFWFRRDLRLDDNPGLVAAAETGPVIPVFVLDPETENQGAAPLWRLGLGIEALAASLEAAGSRLILRRGPALAILRALVAETGAGAVHWSRYYTPSAIARDKAVKEALKTDGIAALSHAGLLLLEPWQVATRAGGFFKVYSPFWRAAAALPVPEPVGAPRLAPPRRWPGSERLGDWRMGARMRRGAAVVAGHLRVGAAAALDGLDGFLEHGIGDYAARRDRPDLPATSGLSENLTYGELSPRRAWYGARRAAEAGARGAETFLRELVWREFAWHLAWHTPHILTRNWRSGWDDFPWRGDGEAAERWRRGMTGEPLVDAGMRELYVTGRMHNRVRMVAASYLAKHLLTHWRIGADWFADCLVDWDPASNALGWQWVAGPGPDAAPYFRVFNPETQAEKFDPDGAYRRRFLAGWDGGGSGNAPPAPEARAFFEAVPLAWRLSPAAPYPARMVGLRDGRAGALEAYARLKRAGGTADQAGPPRGR